MPAPATTAPTAPTAQSSAAAAKCPMAGHLSPHPAKDMPLAPVSRGRSSPAPRRVRPCWPSSRARDADRMRASFPDSRVSGQDAALSAQGPAEPGSACPHTHLIDWRAIRKADRACCCPAKPMVVAVMPPSRSRPNQADLLLCGHHYRASRQALRKAGAFILDIDGIPPGPEATAGTYASSASLT